MRLLFLKHEVLLDLGTVIPYYSLMGHFGLKAARLWLHGVSLTFKGLMIGLNKADC